MNRIMFPISVRNLRAAQLGFDPRQKTDERAILAPVRFLRLVCYELCSNKIACDLTLLICSESWPAVMTKLGAIGNPADASASATHVLHVFHRANRRVAG